MIDLAKRIIDARCGGHVERCHVIPHQGSYNNAAHSWGVAMLMYALWPEDFERLALICLTHDIPEGWTGDPPSFLFDHLPELRAAVSDVEGTVSNSLRLPSEVGLDPIDRAKLKACDRLELYLWCREQKAFGNTFVEGCLGRLRCMFIEKPLPEPAHTLFRQFEIISILPRQGNILKTLGEVSHDAE